MDLPTFVKQSGSQAKAAAQLGVTQGMVWQWLNGHCGISAERAIKIEEKTGGVVTRYELRPEIFGSAPVDNS